MRTLGSVLAFSLMAGSASAATTILTFNTGETACTASDNGPANQACATEGQFIGGNYGSSAELAVTYDASESTGSVTSLRYTADSFFGPGGGMAKLVGPGPELSKIIFTPAAGYEVSFQGFSWDKLTATSSSQFIFEVRDASDALLFSAGNAQLSYAVNTAYFTGPLTFLFGNGGRGAVAVDNVAVDVRAAAVVTPPGGVPEPGAWALMILGFGGVGQAIRRRRTVLA